ncbi:MAG: LytS/YhcK type 5TM receptor domain-containing protein, partial [Vicinamibacterales bacterium]|nr:LytS/YhcK type 5TM receptor domain-containing protein [Vicinamibacterales bacterium]
MIYLDLIVNLTLLVALSVVSGFVDARWPRSSRLGVLVQGALFGGAAVIGMLRPLHLMPGVIFDGRSVMLSLCALFFGPWAAAVATVMTVATRVGLGGGGTIMGVSVILSSVAIGLAARRRIGPEERPPSAPTLWGLGLVVHAAMLALMFTLPAGAGLDTIRRLGVPVLLLYPLATILAGKILSDQVQARRTNASLRQFKTVFDTANFGAVIGAPAGTLTYVNEYFAAAHGYEPRELVGRHASVLHNAAQQDQVARLLHLLETEGQFNAQEVGHCRRDGTVFPMLMTGTVVRDADGARQGFTVTAIDLTEAKAVQAQLQQAQKMESVGRLAGGVAHDFNNMLGVILGHAELALTEVDKAHPLHDHLVEIRAAADRSAGLTRQLLAFARKQTVAPAVLDLNATVTGMLKMLRRLIGEDIDLAWHPSANLWPVKVDPTQIDQLLANLCVNARDAIEGVGKVTIETGMASFSLADQVARPGVLPGDFVRLAVSD